MIHVFFDDIEVNADHIQSLSQSAQVFNENFKLGATICRTFELSILNLSQLQPPSEVVLFEDNNSSNQEEWLRYATLLVDSIDTENLDYTIYSLTDFMIRTNTLFTFEFGHTVKELLEIICENHGYSLATNDFFLDLLQVNWTQEELTERNFISYVAEVNGGYAYVNGDGNLEIKPFTQEISSFVNVDECSSFKLGDRHLIDRVYAELGVASKAYPIEESENDTVYINPENILLVDNAYLDYALATHDDRLIITHDSKAILASGVTITMDDIVRHIYDIINGFEFYNIQVDKCPIDATIHAGSTLAFVLDGNSYRTIANIEWDYSIDWFGGYELELSNKVEEETQLINSNPSVKALSIKVDRQNGVIEQQISDVNGSISDLRQTSDDIQMNFVKKSDEDYVNLTTNITFDVEGINITSNNVDTNLQLASSGVYIKDTQNNNITTMQKNQFTIGQWTMSQTGDAINIFKNH